MTHCNDRYVELEVQAENNSEDPVYGPLHAPSELGRAPGLEADLEYYYGEDWKAQISPSPATQAYVTRLKTVGEEAPELLVAHAYTRYLGDLSGGQQLARVARKAYNLEKGGAGTAFYEFGNIENFNRFKKGYRTKLDELEVSKETSDRLVQEANVAFNLNTAIFEELDVVCGFQTKEELAAKRVAAIAAAKAAVDAPAKCPFAAFGGANPHGPSKEPQVAAAASEDAAGSVGSKCPVHPTALAGMLGEVDAQNVALFAAALVAAYLAVQYGAVFSE